MDHVIMKLTMDHQNQFQSYHFHCRTNHGDSSKSSHSSHVSMVFSIKDHETLLDPAIHIHEESLVYVARLGASGCPGFKPAMVDVLGAGHPGKILQNLGKIRGNHEKILGKYDKCLKK